MPNLGMGLPYILNEDNIRNLVEETPGNYAFGRLGSSNNELLNVKYVGRSDNNLQVEILQQFRLKVTEGGQTYTHFKFIHMDNHVDAYHKECENYHDFMDGLHNEIHPAIPADSDEICKHCPTEEDIEE